MGLKPPGARVMIVGGGARSHALGAALAASPSVGEVVFAPGTSGLERLGFPTAPVASQDLPGLVEHAELEGYDLTVVGPNTPLVDGVVDLFEAAALPIFGPSRAAARLEGSKVFARLLMSRLGVPTPRFAICDNAERALHLARTQRWARVFKVDGIGYGQGVRVTRSFSEVEEALEDILVDNIYGLESNRLVVEERLDGEELTIFCLTDGRDVHVMGHVLNHPRLHDGDQGPPTRGMGQVSPAPQMSARMLDRLVDETIRPTVKAMAEDGRPVVGALFADFLFVGGEPFVLDYNVRFGDPATQTMLSAWRGDFYRVLQACRTGCGLGEALGQMTRDPRPRVSLVVACEGYPNTRVRGAPITLDEATFEDTPDLRLFQDGVRSTDEGIETTGGRTFTVVAAGDTYEAARTLAERGVAAIRFEGMHVRRDIAAGLTGRPA